MTIPTIYFLLIPLESVSENETCYRSMGMAVMVGVNESLQVQRKLDSFLASAPQQTGSVGADSQPLVSPTWLTDNSFHNIQQYVTQALNTVSNEICTSHSML